MKKQQGSALILAILLLAFFMALSLNMLTISRAKAQRAGDAVIGNKVLSDSDSASTLGYYEYNLALEYVKKGFVTTTTYSLTVGGILSTTTSNITIEGISLSSDRDYFGSYINKKGTGFVTDANAFLQSETTTGSGSTLKLVSRNWNANAGGELRDLWYNVTGTSIGGYKIFSLQAKTGVTTTSVVSNGALVGATSVFNTNVSSVVGDVITVYSKNIVFNSSDTAINGNSTYVVYVTRKSVFNGIKSENQRIESDTLESIVVELQK
ncbi:MAG: hypothetical protein JXM74_05415 [Fusobacteriaceae bacterium]|nr:hypothetical protein [Fusobacteriaceae bacterium]MBN2838176.1 hypothetical protein [Fusobacteriaceae bacterium]